MPLKLLFGHLEFSLEGGIRLRIGRAEHLDITINGDPLVSSQHCTIQYGKLCDAQSTNGTMINSTKIPYQTPITLKPGDVITVGETNLFIEDGIPYDGTSSSSSAAASAAGPAVSNTGVGGLSSVVVVAGGSNHASSKNSSRNLSSLSATSTYSYDHSVDGNVDDGVGGEDHDAFSSYSYSNHDLSNTIHSTSEWQEALVQAVQREEEASSDDENDSHHHIDHPPQVDGGVRHHDDVVTYTYGAPPLSNVASSRPSPTSSSNGVVSHRPSSSPSTMRPPSSSSSSSHLVHSPPPSEEELWSLKQALTKSELKCMTLEKKLGHMQRKGNLLQHKQKLQKCENQIQNLEYQMFYGDTMKDRELESLRSALTSSTSTSFNVTSATTDADSNLVLSLRHDLELLSTMIRQMGGQVPILNSTNINNNNNLSNGNSGSVSPGAGAGASGTSSAAASLTVPSSNGNGAVVDTHATLPLNSSFSPSTPHASMMNGHSNSTILHASSSPVVNTIVTTTSTTTTAGSSSPQPCSSILLSNLKSELEDFLKLQTSSIRDVMMTLFKEYGTIELQQRQQQHDVTIIEKMNFQQHQHQQQRLHEGIASLMTRVGSIETSILDKIANLEAANTAAAAATAAASVTSIASPSQPGSVDDAAFLHSSLTSLTRGQNDMQNALATLLEAQANHNETKRQEARNKETTPVVVENTFESKETIKKEMDRAFEQQTLQLTAIMEKYKSAPPPSTPTPKDPNTDIVVRSIQTLHQRVIQFIGIGGAVMAIAIGVAFLR